MAGEWKITHITDEAALEVAFLFQNPDVKSEVKRILKRLAVQDDPRQPVASADLIVDELEFDAPSWFRVKVPRYGIRIVFRLFVSKDEQLIELDRLTPIPNDAAERFLDITQAGYRKDVYGEELRRRYRKSREDN